MFSLKTLLVWLMTTFGASNTTDAPAPPSDNSSTTIVVGNPDQKRGGIYNGF